MFFAGHSESNEDGKIGRILLRREKETWLTIEFFQEALKGAIEHGLQLAIFNSCDGLGLANQLAELNIPQLIVMRESVLDEVAKAFLQNFLTAFACQNKSLYMSVREARAKLEDWEQQFPGIKSLPIICQHPAVIPPTWRNLCGKQRYVPKLPTVLVASMAMAVLVIGVRYLGVLQPVELMAYDQMMQLRPDEGLWV